MFSSSPDSHGGYCRGRRKGGPCRPGVRGAAQEGEQNEQGWERQSWAVSRAYLVVSGTDWQCFTWKQFSSKLELLEEREA